jgi:DNA-binding GntR family transcriptional regulator
MTQPEAWPESEAQPLGEAFRHLREHVYFAILKMITEQHMKPGGRLILDVLAQRFRVSRTPVQYALSRLAAEGLVQPHGRRGFSLIVPTRDDLLQIYDMRLMCETYALENGIRNLTEGLVAGLRKLALNCASLRRSSAAEDRLSSVLKGREIHRRIVELNANPRLTDEFVRLNAHLHALRLGFDASISEARIAGELGEHLAILAALEHGDTQAALGSLRNHILTARAHALERLESQG